MKKVTLLIISVIISLTFIVIYNNESEKSFNELLRFEEELENSYEVILPASITNQPQKEVYSKIKKVLNETNSNIYYSRIENQKKIKYIYVTKDEYINKLSIIGRNLNKSDMDTQNYISTRDIVDKNQIGKLNTFSKKIEYEIRPLNQLIESGYYLDGYVYINFNSNDNIDGLIDRLEKELQVKEISVNKTNGVELQNSSMYLLVNIILYIVIILTIIYSLIKKYKKIAIEKLMGASNQEIIFKLLKNNSMIYINIVIVISVVLSLIFFENYNILYWQFIGKLCCVYTIQLILLLTILFVIFQYVKKIKVANMLKNKKQTKEIIIINQVSKIIFLVGFIIIIALCISQYKSTEITYTDSLKQWEELEGYYSIPTTINQSQGFMNDDKYWEFCKNVYIDFSNGGGILADFSEYIPFTREIREKETQYQYERDRVTVNPNYLEKYEIYDVFDNRIKIDESETDLIFLVPEKYKEKEKDIIEMIKRRKEIEETKEPRIIWTKNNQKLFSMMLEVNSEQGNMVEDPIVKVRTNSNGGIYDYMYIIGMSDNPYKIKIPDGIEAKEYIKEVLGKYGESNIIDEVIKANDGIMGKTDNIKEVLMYLAIAISTLGTITLIIIIQSVNNYFEHRKKKLIIYQLNGYRWIDKYNEYLVMVLFTWFIIINSLLISKAIPVYHIILISIFCIAIEILTSSITFYLISKRKVTNVIKGAE